MLSVQKYQQGLYNHRVGNTAIFRAASEDVVVTLLESGLEGVKANRNGR